MSLKEAGRELIKANLGLALNQLINPATYVNNNLPVTTNIPYDIMSMGGDGVGAYYAWNGIASSLTAYEQCPPLKAVCNRRALAFTNAEISVRNSLGKTSTSTQAKKILRLLNNPNPLQTKAAFLSQVSIYMDLVGYAVIVPLRPVGFDISESESLWVVPPALCTLNTASTQLNFSSGGIDSVTLGNVTVRPDMVMIIQDIDPSVHQMVIPSSKVKALEHPINNIIGAYQSESNLIKQRGPSGIITGRINPQLGAPIPLLPAEKSRLQGLFNSMYGFMNGQSSIILTDAALEYTKTGFNAQELMLHESISEATKAICDTIGYPAELLSVTDSKYDNMKQADLSLYTKFIMPRAKNIAEQLSSYLLPITDNFYFGYSHLPELQKDKGEEEAAKKVQADRLKMEFDNDLITLDEWLQETGRDPLPEGAGQFRRSQLKRTDVPLASIIGLGGTQSLLAIQTAALEPDVKINTLMILFGVSRADAECMVGGGTVTETDTQTLILNTN